MRTKAISRGLVLLAAVAVAAVFLVPGMAAAVGRLVGGLWVTVMGALVALLGGVFRG